MPFRRGGRIGAQGGKEAARRATRKKSPAHQPAGSQGDASSKGCQPNNPTYTLQHITRHFLIAADESGIVNYEGLRYSDIEAYMPDVTKQAQCICDEGLDDIRTKYGLDPLYVSCNLCFASQLEQDDLRAVLAAPYCDL